ncbi:hypothetical protein Tco_0635788 [Tanacetum coccineum]
MIKRGQSAQTVRMLTNSKTCYDHSSKQAIGFEKPLSIKKARESKPKRYDVPDSDETLELNEKSRSKMLLKEQDPLFLKYKINTKPINYDILNNDYYKRFVRQTDLYSEHAYWKATSVPPLDPSHSSATVIVEVPKELPTVSMVNTSLKKLKRHLTGFDQVVKERTTATAITEGTWGFEHTKACFRDEIIPFIKEHTKALIRLSKKEPLPQLSLRARGGTRFGIASLKNELRKLKGKAIDMTHSVDPNMSKDNMEPITPKLLNKRTAHSSYIKHTQEEALVLRDIVEHVKANYPQDPLLESAFRSKTVLLMLRDLRLCRISRNKIILILSILTNKVEAHPRNVKSSLNKRNGTVKVNGSASVQNSKKHDNSDYVCINGDDCMSSDNLCVSNSMNDVKFRAKPKKRKSKKEIWKPTGKVFTKKEIYGDLHVRTFTIVLNAKPRKNKNTESVSKTKVVQIVLWYLDSSCSKHMTGDRSQLTNFISKFLGTVKFGNDQVAKIMGYGDYQIGNVTISRVYYVEGLGHNLFFVGQFCDSNLEVAFRQHTCFIHNLEGVDLLTGS